MSLSVTAINSDVA